MGIVAVVVRRAEATTDLETVYREDGARLWRALYAYSNDREVASDAAAEAFAQALGRGSAIRDVRPWVWRAAFRLAAGDLKNRSKYASGPMPEGVTHDFHLDDELVAALQSLTAQQRLVIVLHYYVDCPVREISRRTGMNPLAVRSHLSRGRQRMRLLLGNDS
jgi:RNA polymerase sigma-70 factor (ECF subfamily)